MRANVHCGKTNKARTGQKRQQTNPNNTYTHATDTHTYINHSSLTHTYITPHSHTQPCDGGGGASSASRGASLVGLGDSGGGNEDAGGGVGNDVDDIGGPGNGDG